MSGTLLLNASKIHVVFHYYYFFVDFTRCGDESSQCIKVSDVCDNIMDCVNGWDEDVERCEDTTENPAELLTTRTTRQKPKKPYLYLPYFSHVVIFSGKLFVLRQTVWFVAC